MIQIVQLINAYSTVWDYEVEGWCVAYTSPGYISQTGYSMLNKNHSVGRRGFDQDGKWTTSSFLFYLPAHVEEVAVRQVIAQNEKPRRTF